MTRWRRAISRSFSYDLAAIALILSLRFRRWWLLSTEGLSSSPLKLINIGYEMQGMWAKRKD